MNYLNTKTNQLCTPKVLELEHPELTTPNAIRKAGFVKVEYAYPEHDKNLYTLKARDGLTKAADGENFVQEFDIVDLPLETARENLKAVVTAKRWDVETGGLKLPDGTTVLTGIDDQNRIDSTISRMKDANIESVKFKASSGWVELTQAQVQAIGVAIAMHVEACFANECALHEKIDAAKSVSALAKIDLNAGWPATANTGEGE